MSIQCGKLTNLHRYSGSIVLVCSSMLLIDVRMFAWSGSAVPSLLLFCLPLLVALLCRLFCLAWLIEFCVWIPLSSLSASVVLSVVIVLMIRLHVCFVFKCSVVKISHVKHGVVGVHYVKCSNRIDVNCWMIYIKQLGNDC